MSTFSDIDGAAVIKGVVPHLYSTVWMHISIHAAFFNRKPRTPML